MAKIKRRNLKRIQKEIIELKSTIIKMENLLGGFTGKSEWAEERTNEPKDRTVKTLESKQKGKKKKKRRGRLKENEQSLKDQWDMIKWVIIILWESHKKSVRKKQRE